MKNRGRTFQAKGGADRKVPGVLKELEGVQEEMGKEISQGNALGFYSMGRCHDLT